ncbi:MAG: ABC transporter ATP-binding protein [Sedimentisphaerales bacterium]|nr:ABC transporter ATP-binding protein [Sedimentisphaerales bacterium]
MVGTNGQFVVETFSLTKIFTDWWGRSRVVAVEDLNLKVRQNEVFGLLGPNGSGKTTVLKMLLGLLWPTKGRAIILNNDIRNPKISAKVGFLPEESYLYPYLNARETLDFYGRLFGLNSKLRRARIDALLDMVGLAGMASRPIGTFSKGMARRIGLAQALINDPELLILDEPTSGLDPIGTRQMKDLIVELAKRGKSVLLCSHLLADAEEVCDRIAILYGGHMQRLGSVDELLKQANKRQITTDVLSADVIDKIRHIIESQGSEFNMTEPMQRLESFFIDIIRQAQQEKRPTSGAINRLDATVAERTAAVANVLDKLINAKVESGGPAEPQRKVETVRLKPNEDVLSQLTEDTQQDAMSPSQTAEPRPDQQAREQIEKEVLDELVEGQDSAEGQESGDDKNG